MAKTVQLLFNFLGFSKKSMYYSMILRVSTDAKQLWNVNGYQLKHYFITRTKNWDWWTWLKRSFIFFLYFFYLLLRNNICESYIGCNDCYFCSCKIKNQYKLAANFNTSNTHVRENICKQTFSSSSDFLILGMLINKKVHPIHGIVVGKVPSYEIQCF